MAIDSSKIILGLPSLPSDSLPKELWDDFKIIYNAIRNLAEGVSVYAGVDVADPVEWPDSPPSDTILSGNLTRMYPIATVGITAGQIVNLFDNAGSTDARLASANSATTMAHGIALTSAGIGQRFQMQWLRSYVGAIGGMIPGTLYWLSPTAGAVQNLPPLAAGTIRQPIGLAIAPAQMIMDIPLDFQQN